MAINFRDLVIDSIEELIVWGPDNAAQAVNQSLQLQEAGSSLPNMALSRSTYTDDIITFDPTDRPENGYFSRVWKVEKRPSTSVSISASKLAPLAFIFVNSGSRPANVAADLGSESEALLVGIDVVLREGFGVQQDGNANVAQTITQQVNAFVTDFDVLFNGNTLQQTDFSSLATLYGEAWRRIRVVEHGIVDWAVGQEVDAQGRASDYEILTFSLQVDLVYPKVLNKTM